MRAVAAALALVLACARAPLPPAAIVAPPGVGPLPSRQRDQGADGFFLQPAGLADDYPEESGPAEKMKRDLEVVRAVGARHLRFAVGWDSTEVEPGKYDWSEWDALFGLLRQAGVTPLPYICYTPRWLAPSDPKAYWRRPADPRRFARFVSALVERYRVQAPSWELRSAISLAKLYCSKGKPSEALSVLRPIYDQFTEGFSTTDLVRAKDLLRVCL